ncbi:MAG: hypothetical protein ACJZ8O_13045 [Pirellulaceae bacterium]
MSCDRPENQLNEQSDELNHDQNHGQNDTLPVTEATTPTCVPVFNCIVYVNYGDDSVHARVANLAGLSCDANNERDALGKLIPLFKTMLKEFTEGGIEVPWIDPVPEAAPGEQVRLIPVHL